MIKPLVDDRKYRLVKLSNNLEVLLISDINSSTSAAALSVGVGSFKDDPNIPGLAHFCEHMIFLVNGFIYFRDPRLIQCLPSSRTFYQHTSVRRMPLQRTSTRHSTSKSEKRDSTQP